MVNSLFDQFFQIEAFGDLHQREKKIFVLFLDDFVRVNPFDQLKRHVVRNV